VILNVDGGARGNPGPAAIGFVIRDAESGEILAEHGEAIGHATNNVAEYRALIEGVKAVAALGARSVEIRGDSQLIVEQVKGNWKVKEAGLKPLRAEAVEALAGLGDWTLDHVRRERNAEADALVNRALDAG
jgi:probable phosphoglycerate mutase